MAAVEKEIQQLNKTVNEAVNMLKVYWGNSAQIKNMNEKQKEAVMKWFDVVDEAEEQQKRQRAFVERERDEKGRFFTKESKQKEAANKSFMGMAKSVGGMFKNMTSKVTTGLQNLASGIAQNVAGVFAALKGHFLSLFGEESEWFDLLSSIKDSVTGFVGWFAKGFMMIFRRTPVWAGKMIKTLKDMYKLQVKEMKMDFLGAGGKKEGGVSMMGLIGGLIFAIGAAIGAFMHRYFVLITKLPIFQRVAQWFTKLDDIPFIGKLFKAIKFGFKWLGWPLTIILSVIDFIRGFAETEGTLFDKIKGGLWEALEGFIELPVMAIGWVVEKVAGWFGVEVEGVAGKIMNVLQGVFDLIMDFNPMKPFIDFIEGFWNKEGTFTEKLKAGMDNLIAGMMRNFEKWIRPLMDAITPIVAGVHNFFVDFWNSVVEWIQGKIPDWMPGRDKIVKGLMGMEMSRMEVPTDTTSPVEAMNDLEKKKIAEQEKKDEKTAEALDKLDKSVQEQGQKTSDSINAAAISQTAGGGAGGAGETQQIPDEVENMGVIYSNVMF